jgi:O-antigen/teichoic acid export membrane protein
MTLLSLLSAAVVAPMAVAVLAWLFGANWLVVALVLVAVIGLYRAAVHSANNSHPQP